MKGSKSRGHNWEKVEFHPNIDSSSLVQRIKDAEAENRKDLKSMKKLRRKVRTMKFVKKFHLCGCFFKPIEKNIRDKFIDVQEAEDLVSALKDSEYTPEKLPDSKRKAIKVMDKRLKGLISRRQDEMEDFHLHGIQKRNKDTTSEKPTLSAEEKQRQFLEFVETYKPELEDFGRINNMKSSEKFLLNHSEIVTSEGSNFLALKCLKHAIDQEMEEFEIIAHQVVIMQYILQLADYLEVEPKFCIKCFFNKIKNSQLSKQHLETFNQEYRSLMERFHQRANQIINAEEDDEESDDASLPIASSHRRTMTTVH